MLSLAGVNRDGKPLFILGIEPENVRRLTAGQPIEVNLSTLDGPDVEVVILYADDTASAELEKLRAKIGPNPLAAANLGATNEYPDGQLGPRDEGEIRMAVSHLGHIVRIDFGKRLAWVGMGAEHARALARALLKHANEAEEAIPGA